MGLWTQWNPDLHAARIRLICQFSDTILDSMLYILRNRKLAAFFYIEFGLCRHYRGRGAFETMGAGLDMIPGDIAFKVRKKGC